MDDEIIIDDIEGAETGKRPRWYLVHTYSGFEQRVEKTVKEYMRTGQDHGQILDCVVPTERVIELSKTGLKRTTTRSLSPGHVIIHMIITEDSWNLV